MTKKTIIILMLSLPLGLFSQSSKKAYKNGIKLLNENQYYEALIEFNHAIRSDSSNANFYAARAKTYVLIKNMDMAALDYEKAAILEPEMVAYSFEAGKSNYLIQNYAEALKYLSATLVLDNKNFEAYLYKSLTHISLEEYEAAILASDNALSIEQNNICYYTKGIANDSLANYDVAIIDYSKSIELSLDTEKPYLALTKVYLKKNDLDLALESANTTVKLFPSLSSAFELRSMVYHVRGNIPAAINDLSKAETLSNNVAEILFLRGLYYFEYRQYQNAKSDFTQFINLDPDKHEAFYWRARASEEIMDLSNALSDYQTFLNNSHENQSDSNLIIDAQQRIFELKRENIAPVVIIDIPSPEQSNNLIVPFNSETITIEGKIEDSSKIESLTLNNINVLRNDSNRFKTILAIPENKKIIVIARDVYGNETLENYNIIVLENNGPTITITSPQCDENATVFCESNTSILVLQGKIHHLEKINKLSINQQDLMFNSAEINPSFTANINVKNTNSIAIKIVDVMGSTYEKKYKIKFIKPI